MQLKLAQKWTVYTVHFCIYSLASLCVSGYSLVGACCLQSPNPTALYLKKYVRGPVNSEFV